MTSQVVITRCPDTSVMEPSNFILRLSNLHKLREQGNVRFSLHIPEFALFPGQFVAIVGDSGCGKSTLLDMLALVSKPTGCQHFHFAADRSAGPVIDIWDLWSSGEESALATIRRRDLGYVLQTGGLMPFLTVEENIRLPLRIQGVKIERREIESLAERIDIKAILSKKSQHISGGQRQRAAILRALVHKPRMILADEPTAAVDKKRARAIVQDFKGLASDRGTTIVMVTHDYDLVKDYADVTYTFDLTEISSVETHSVCRKY